MLLLGVRMPVRHEKEDVHVQMQGLHMPPEDQDGTEKVRKHGEVPCPRCEGASREPGTSHECLNPSCYEGKIWIGP